VTERELAAVGLTGHVCDLIGGLYLAYDVFRRHAGPLGVLTRAVTYSVLAAVPSWLALGLPFGAICGTGFGFLVSWDHWRLARFQRLERSSPLTQSAPAGAVRGVVLGLALIPRYGWRFGLTAAAACAALGALVYGLRWVPTYRSYPGCGLLPPVPVLRAGVLRGVAFGAGVALAAVTTITAFPAARLGGEVGGLVALVSFAIGAVAPRVEYWTEKAGDSFFVYAGLTLLFCGLLCDSVPHILELLR